MRQGIVPALVTKPAEPAGDPFRLLEFSRRKAPGFCFTLATRPSHSCRTIDLPAGTSGPVLRATRVSRRPLAEVTTMKNSTENDPERRDRPEFDETDFGLSFRRRKYGPGKKPWQILVMASIAITVIVTASIKITVGLNGSASATSRQELCYIHSRI